MRTPCIALCGALMVIGTLVTGCAQKPITRLVRVPHVEYAPIPATLTQPCIAKVGQLVTQGDLARAYIKTRHALRVCNSRMEAIRALEKKPRH